MPPNEQPRRPALRRNLSGAEFRRWYWTTAELATFARSLGLSTRGNKASLTEQIADLLDGRETPEPPGAVRPTAQLRGPLTEATVIPRGQRCSQVLRAWFRAEIGPGFRFDEAMRDFFAHTSGDATLADAVVHWHQTRGQQPNPIGSQFELNRFTRRWYAQHPTGDRAQLMAAWREYRSLPVDVRGRV